MNYTETQASFCDGAELANLRVLSMQESLTSIGRFDPERARERFLSSFVPSDTTKIIVSEQLAGFYAAEVSEAYIFLAHLYVHPEHQGYGIGGDVLVQIKRRAHRLYLPIKLGALRESRSNEFYIQHGFRKTHEDEWDIYYEYTHS